MSNASKTTACCNRTPWKGRCPACGDLVAPTRPTSVRVVSDEEGMPRGGVFEVVGWTGFDQAVVRDERDECLLVLNQSDFEAAT